MDYTALKSLLVLGGLTASLAVFFVRMGRVLRSLGYPAPQTTLPAGESLPPHKCGYHLAALRAGLTAFFGQKRLFRLPGPGVAHYLIFWGFLFLFFTILQSLTDGLAAWTGAAVRLPFITDFPPLALAQDLLALGTLGGVFYGLDLRLRVKPDRFRGSHNRQGWLVLGAILVILTSLLAMNAAAISLERESGAWRPVSAGLALLLTGLPVGLRAILYETAYGLHLAVILLFLAELPAGKHLHILTALPALVWRNTEATGKLPPAPVFDGILGAASAAQMAPRRILDFYTCTECGRCQDVCPAYSCGAPLSPKRLMMDLRAGLAEPFGRLPSGVVPAETIWACTTCLACQQACPLFIEHVPTLVQLRRRLVEEGAVPPSLQNALESLAAQGNTFGLPPARRGEWAQAIKPPVPDARDSAVDYLWITGDTAAFDPAVLQTTRRTAELLRMAGVDFGILYEEEQNAGGDVRRAGEEGLFLLLRERNLGALAKARFSAIITGDPHTLHTLKTEYDLPAGTAVLHISELLADLVESGRLPVRRRLSETVTFHDPCYLGRYQGIYDPPRRLIQAAGCKLIEMAEHGPQARCCGAGGGRYWLDEGGGKERPSEQRIRQAAALTEVTAFITACPKDLVMFGEAVQSCGLDGRLRVRDLGELIYEACR